MAAASSFSSDIVLANNDFGFRLLHRLSLGSLDENILISPFSISLGLTMAYNGAEGRTRQEMAELLHLGNMGTSPINAANASLHLSLKNADPEVQLQMANVIWVLKGEAINADFRKLMRDYYEAELFSTAGDEVLSSLNQWIKEKTEGRIEMMLNAADVSKAIVILINAIYFKGFWSAKFDRADTKEMPFTTADQRQKLLPQISASGRYRYFEDDLLAAIRLPYGSGRLCMYILLPKEAGSFPRFCRDLNADSWQELIPKLSCREGRIAMPRFKLNYSVKLNSILQAMGMSAAFGGAADFSGICKDLCISHVLHKSFIEVDEEGTEAAASTAVIMIRAISEASSRFNMVVDHPFFFAIRDDVTGVILFMGFIAEPNQG